MNTKTLFQRIVTAIVLLSTISVQAQNPSTSISNAGAVELIKTMSTDILRNLVKFKQIQHETDPVDQNNGNPPVDEFGYEQSAESGGHFGTVDYSGVAVGGLLALGGAIYWFNESSIEGHFLDQPGVVGEKGEGSGTSGCVAFFAGIALLMDVFHVTAATPNSKINASIQQKTNLYHLLGNSSGISQMTSALTEQYATIFDLNPKEKNKFYREVYSGLTRLPQKDLTIESVNVVLNHQSVVPAQKLNYLRMLSASSTGPQHPMTQTQILKQGYKTIQKQDRVYKKMIRHFQKQKNEVAVTLIEREDKILQKQIVDLNRKLDLMGIQL